MTEILYFSIAEVAKILGISRIAVYNKVKKGQIKSIRIGKSFAIPNEEVKRLIINIKGTTLSDKDKRGIDKVVARTIKVYGETLRKLGSE